MFFLISLLSFSLHKPSRSLFVLFDLGLHHVASSSSLPSLQLKAMDRPHESDKVPRAPHDRKKEWQKLALGAELAQDIPEEKHREENGSAGYHDNRSETFDGRLDR